MEASSTISAFSKPSCDMVIQGNFLRRLEEPQCPVEEITSSVSSQINQTWLIHSEFALYNMTIGKSASQQDDQNLSSRQINTMMRTNLYVTVNTEKTPFPTPTSQRRQVVYCVISEIQGTQAFLFGMIKPLQATGQATLFSHPADPFGKLDMIGHHEKKLGTVTY